MSMKLKRSVHMDVVEVSLLKELYSAADLKWAHFKSAAE